ncbi:MAG: hypothetical protein AB7L91_08190 [Dehalococcoidia bacterium]
MAQSNAQSGIRLELLWLLALLLSLLAVVTWRFALAPGDDEPAAGAATATPAATSAAVRVCGEEVDSPGSELNLAARECLLAAAPTGERVEFTTTRFTVEGQPVYWRVRVLAWGDIEVTIDNRADEFSGPARRRILTHRCTSLARSATEEHRIDVLGCAGGESLIF